MTTFLDPGTDEGSAAVLAGRLVFATASAAGSAPASVADETTLCLDRLENTLGRLGCGLGDLVKVNCYLSEDSYRSEFWQTWDARFTSLEVRLVRITQVVGIPGGRRVHLDATAVRPEAAA
ncbi:RidA family protein [Amycolatopsis sp. Poz14]|uniref:RidA family protein n=1 Tax=Amycolatopsis sp. Poz14 TaxID=1447705 RepID=UPI001EE7DCAC|nr:RidA family protein [Amycolatopsis sp. Poz14]MCG3754059.1 RidA family protein [Amycolatopsis sp. Poz14]